MSEALEVITEEITVEVHEDGAVEVVEVGLQGPPGAPGGGVVYRLRQTVPADGGYSFALDPATLEASIQVFVNGLLEDDWTWSAPTLTINFPLVAGDDVEIRYQV